MKHFIVTLAVIVTLLSPSVGKQASSAKILNEYVQYLFQKRVDDLKETMKSIQTKTDEPFLSTELIQTLNGVLVPDADLPDSLTELKELQNEDPESLYYGYASEPDYAKARLVAYAILQKQGLDGLGKSSDPRALVIAPTSVLMMVYANGHGVARNFELAQKFAVIASEALAEAEGMIQTLSSHKESNWQGNDFRLCAHVTSGYMGGYCQKISDEKESANDDKRFSQILNSWTRSEKAAFNQLKKISYSYFAAAADADTDQTGTLRTAFVIDARRSQISGFVNLLEQLEKKDVPAVTGEDFQKSDQELNKVYKQLMNAFPEGGMIEHTTINKSDVQIAQRQWIRYRDAWASFTQLKYPDISLEAVKKLLTDQRVKELKDVLNINSVKDQTI
ncbi:MAG: DUF1311 domain-containing protein [Proteobacteria bacterium]|nr:DUF1311 domain-containing protein [Pseudomonadota bacterium]